MPVTGVDYAGNPIQTAQGPVALKWDPKNLEIRTTSVERTLEPLVIQVDESHRPSIRPCISLIRPVLH